MFFSMRLFGYLLVTSLVSSTYVWGVEQFNTEAAQKHSVERTLTTNNFNPYHFYTFRQDYRKCLAPLCGGIFVKSVNKKVTHCPDGTVQTECYVALVLSQPTIELSSAHLLQGTLLNKAIAPFTALPVMRLKHAYRSATPALIAGVVVGLQDNGIRCVTTPCFATNSYYLNKHKVRAVSAFDLSAVGSSEATLAQAFIMYDHQQVVLASGKFHVQQTRQGNDVTFTAQQFYLPIIP
ncbi:MAG: DUF6748 domain-containing protein [Methylovulum sp.]|jgi:hypothetical protein